MPTAVTTPAAGIRQSTTQNSFIGKDQLCLVERIFYLAGRLWSTTPKRGLGIGIRVSYLYGRGCLRVVFTSRKEFYTSMRELDIIAVSHKHAFPIR